VEQRGVLDVGQTRDREGY